jgi:hypothetical protein
MFVDTCRGLTRFTEIALALRQTIDQLDYNPKSGNEKTGTGEA